MRPKPDPAITKTLGAVDPCPEEWMTMENPRWTICQILREIYQASDSPKVRIRARIAMTMAKKMNDRLLSHSDKLSEQWDGSTNEMGKILDGIV